jgi:hypothetical protein
MVQELLNRSDDYLWAILANANTVRLLRDSTSLVGSAYVEFDLEAIFDGDLFADAEFRMSPVVLGQDADGDELTSLVAWHLATDLERAQARQDEVNAGRAGHGYTFQSLLDTCTEEASLRRAFYAMLEGLSDEAKKKAYQRAKARAINDGLMDIVEGKIIDRRKGQSA